MKKKKTKRVTKVLMVLILIIGLSLLLYPSISDYWNSFHQTQAIATYESVVTDTNHELHVQMIKDATAYNEDLARKSSPWVITKEEHLRYEQLLDVTGTGIMGYLEIPVIDISLPIYHSVEESVLQVAIGHMEGSSLPVGGKGTHSVLTGHRGLPSAKLLTQLDEVKVGDIFTLQVLDETLTYEVDQILTVEPDDITALGIVDGQDYCTLVTCTPYGVNTHRLLVRGYRIDNLPDAIRVSADAVEIDPLFVAPVVAMPILVVLFVIVLIRTRRINIKDKYV